MGGPAGRPSDRDLGRHLAGHPGPKAVGADDESGRDPDRLPLGVVADDAGDPAQVTGDAGDRHAGPHLGAGLDGGVDQQLVEDMTPGGDQEVDTGTALDLTVDDIAAHVEADAADRGGTGVQDGVEQPPTGELHHPTPGDRMGRQRVAGEGRPVDHDDPVALAGQEHGEGGAGAAGADDHDVGGGKLVLVHAPTVRQTGR